MRCVRVLVGVAAMVGVCMAVSAAGARAPAVQSLRFTATLYGSVTTKWSVPEQLLSSTCYDDTWQRGVGGETVRVGMSSTRALVTVYAGKSSTISLGSWQLYHGGSAPARENLARHGTILTFHRPGNCGKGGNALPTSEGPGGCGTRSGTPEVSLSQLGSNHKWQAYVADTKGQLRPFSNCPVFYGSNDVPNNMLSPILGRISIQDLLNMKNGRITLKFRHKWHHGRGHAVTNYYVADTNEVYTFELTRVK